MYILDTNIVSELRRLRPHGGLLAWLKAARDGEIHIAAATVGEIRAGIEKAREHNVDKATELERWMSEVVLTMNVLIADAETFRIWAVLMHKKQTHLWDDAMIAATALQHRATVVTRNIRDFQQFDVDLFNPFERGAT